MPNAFMYKLLAFIHQIFRITKCTSVLEVLMYYDHTLNLLQSLADAAMFEVDMGEDAGARDGPSYANGQV